MATCDDKVTEDLLFDCADKPKKGIEGSKAVIINIDDIDSAASTRLKETITDVVLKSGTTGFKAEWFKDLGNTSGTFAPNAEDIDGFTHAMITRLSNSSAVNAARANELSQGRFIIAVETRYKGVDNLDAFKIYGWEHGMKLSEMTNSTNEMSGSTPYTLATEEGDVESYPYNIFLETDYATSKATFETLFAAIV